MHEPDWNREDLGPDVSLSVRCEVIENASATKQDTSGKAFHPSAFLLSLRSARDSDTTIDNDM